jgi:hypothetical protein
MVDFMWLISRALPVPMVSKRARRRLLVGLAAYTLVCADAEAHAFGALYNLPVPFTLYAYGATLALAVSFVLLALLSRQAAPILLVSDEKVNDGSIKGQIGLFVLVVTVIVGYAGPPVPDASLSFNIFWIQLLLGLQYFSVVAGNVFGPFNPWRELSTLVEKRLPRRRQHPLEHLPEHWGDYYVFVLFYALVWIELFGNLTPKGLATVLLVYTIANCMGSLLVGKERWYANFELFGAFFSLAGSAALHLIRSSSPRGPALRTRLEFLPVRSVGSMLFMAFMLSATAFDGIRDTQLFVSLFWVSIYNHLTPYIGTNIVESFPLLQRIFHAFNWACLALSPLPFLLALYAVGACSRQLTGASQTTLEIARSFLPSLIPIAVAYNFVHYFTLLFSEGPRFFQLLSDPIGRGWNLFGTADSDLSIMIPINMIWHIQVSVVLLGHIFSVYVAHLIALRIFTSRRKAVVSQFPMMGLMVLYTTAGLWILSQPLTTASALVR